jgi:hypothetical protein
MAMSSVSRRARRACSSGESGRGGPRNIQERKSLMKLIAHGKSRRITYKDRAKENSMAFTWALAGSAKDKDVDAQPLFSRCARSWMAVWRVSGGHQCEYAGPQFSLPLPADPKIVFHVWNLRMATRGAGAESTMIFNVPNNRDCRGNRGRRCSRLAGCAPFCHKWKAVCEKIIK